MKSVNLFYVMCLCLSAFALHAEDYQIRMDSKSEVGEKFLQVGEGSLSEDILITADGKPVKANKTEFNSKIKGVCTVLEIDKLKRPVKLKFVVDKCLVTYADNPNEMEFLQKDSEIIIEKQGEKSVFLFHGKPLPPRITKILELFFSLPHSDVTDNDVFAPKERKKVGDTWSINSKVAAEDFSGMAGAKITPDDIKGTVTLEKVVMVGKTKCLVLKGDVEMKNIKIPIPPVLKLKKSTMSASLSGDFPVDPDKKSYDTLKSEETFSANVEAEGQGAPNQPMVKMIMKMKRSVKEEVTTLK